MTVQRRLDQIYSDVIKLVDRNELWSLSGELVKRPSPNPPGEVSEVSSFVQEYMTRAGVETRLEEVSPGRPNVYCVLRGSEQKPVLMLNGHMDVVPVGEGWTMDPFGGQIVGDRLYGRGAADMKAGLAAIMVAMKSMALAGTKLRGTLLLSAVVDEEQGETGTRKMMDSGITSTFAIVGEPTSLSTVIASKGDVYYEITTVGKAAHSSTPSEGINAIDKMADVIGAIRNLSREFEARQHRLLGSPTISVGTIEGGTATNVVPSLCKATVDRRTLPGETAEEGKRQLESIISNLKQKDPQLEARVRTVMEAYPMEVPEDSLIVQTAREATKHVLGHDTGVVGMQGATDAQLLYNVAQIPSVILGPGALSQAHRPNEYVPLSEVLDAAKIYARIALSLLL